ncbi:MAG TPA: hypothetical protein ENF75_06645 [Acidilobales archaeon]|nr:MAG: hypothetical protein B6U85_04610 [Desulfurococcales archaeon ex4484_42]HDD26742.1 hypothetical protein [Acidilobales archaeon]
MFFRKRKKSKEEIKRDLARLLIYAKQGIIRSDYFLHKIHSKIEDLELKYISIEDPQVKAVLRKELSQLRRLETLLAKFSIALEVVATKIETILLTGTAIWNLVVIKEIIKELKKSELTSIPELGLVIEELANGTLSTINNAEIILPEGYSDIALKEEAARILKEAEVAAEAKIKSLEESP